MSRWLLEAGTRPVREESEPCGIFYCSRFYRLRDRETAPSLGGVEADLVAGPVAERAAVLRLTHGAGGDRAKLFRREALGDLFETP